MSRVQNEPEALDAFRQELMAFDRLLQEEYRRVVSDWQSLADIWNDDQYRECGSSLAEVGRGIEAYIAASESHEEFLHQLVAELIAVQSIHVRR